MKTKLVALPVALLMLAALSSCGGDTQAGGEPSASETPAPATTQGSTTTGTRTEEGGETATLEVGGDPGAQVSGTCTVGDGEPEEIGGQVPLSFTYSLEGEPLSCEIASENEIEVDLTAGNTRSVQRLSGGTLNLTYENGSISSSTSSSSVSSRSSSSATGANDGSGNVTSETREVSGFDEVELNGVGNLSIRQAGNESLTVEAEESVLPKIRTEVVDGRLFIGPEPNTNIETNEPINYELNVEDLRALELSGSGDIEVEDVSVDALTVTIDGAGTVEISGRADSQEVSVDGSGEYLAEDLESKNVEVSVDGAGSAVVNASETLDAKVGGAGSVEYVGNPTVNQNVSGVGEVRKR